ncbi:MAG TPA: hypothetical protein VGN81_32500 [Pseudonocardiaceae bacterium]|jgi:hypothetical protein
MDGKLSGRKLARFGTVIAAALAFVAGLSATADAAPAHRQPLAVSSLGFATSQVDAAQGNAAVAVNWTVTDADAAATLVDGTIQFQLAGATPGTYVGETYTVDYQLNSVFNGQASYVSGNAASSSYTYTFAVPRFAATSTAHWIINNFTLKDDQQNSLTLTGRQLRSYGSDLTATETVDTSKPYYGYLVYQPTTISRPPYLYMADGNYAFYSFEIQDQNSGLWKGTITITGPGGATLSAGFTMSTLDGQISTYPCQAFGSTTQVDCDVPIRVPQGTATGAWSVSTITLTSNVGVTATYTNLGAAPITMTADAGFNASGFSVSPNPANNWRTTQTVNLTLTPSGAQQGVREVDVDTNGFCPQASTTPTANPDGSLSVQLSFVNGLANCNINGIVLIDGAGDIALYGQDYLAPDPKLIITRTPDTTPPSVSSVSINPASLAQSAIPSTFVTVTAQAAIGIAPINGDDVYVYDSSGSIVDQETGGGFQAADGSVKLDVPLPYGLAPGTYTIGFQLDDKGGLSTAYGTPNGQPMPGGPLQLTITAG